MISTGEWAMPYGDFFAGTYEEVLPTYDAGYPYFDLMDLSFQGQGGAQQQNSNMGNYNM